MSQTPAKWDWVEPYVQAAQVGTAHYALESGRPPEDPDLVLAVGLRETWLGYAPGYEPRGLPDGAGDRGHGRGLFQIDDRGPYRHLIRPAPWPVVTQVEACAEVLSDARRELTPWRGDPRYEQAVACAYNSSPGRVAEVLSDPKGNPDAVTTGSDYGSDVLRLLGEVRRMRRDACPTYLCPP